MTYRQYYAGQALCGGHTISMAEREKLAAICIQHALALCEALGVNPDEEKDPGPKYIK